MTPTATASAILPILQPTMIEIIKLLADIGIAVTAIVSLVISIRAIKKSDWNSAMNTAPSLVLRPKTIDVIKTQSLSGGGAVYHEGSTIKKTDNAYLQFLIEFKCENAGKGFAFNINNPVSKGMKFLGRKYSHIPLYLAPDDSFTIIIQLIMRFDEWEKIADKKIGVNLSIDCTNDQNNVYCRSFWSAKIKPLKQISPGVLQVEDRTVLQRKGKIEYSPKSFI